MTLDDTVVMIQQAFPRVYFACHTRHSDRRSGDVAISARDADLLAHLDGHAPVRASRLAAHLGRARSTVSEAVARLFHLGLITQSAAGLRLTAAGVAEVASRSVLESTRLRTILEGASPTDRRRIADGFKALLRVASAGTDV